ncbi:MAG: aminoglycoside phosphotransferase family protein [Propionibacteriales bacterium]|nr:aminoglycoside phosphotransferase family protein [Propionibacteriales bacterium]
MPNDPDGAELLTTDAVGELLQVAVEHGGGKLIDWELDHVDNNPQQSTTATYTATVEWSFGRREELLGVSARAGGSTTSDQRAVLFADGAREVAVWLYPRDPDLPGLQRAAFPTEMAEVLNEQRVLQMPVTPDQVTLEMIGYRPRRRAVLKCTVATPQGPVNYFVKVLREQHFAEVRQRHDLLLAAGVPAPPVVATTPDHLLVLAELPGRPLAQAIFDPVAPCSGENLVAVLDAMPSAVAGLPRRPPWSDAVDHYADMVVKAMPDQEPRLRWMATLIRQGLANCPLGTEATHGDFHEGQLFVANGVVSGILDVDTAGPGRRADDLACMIAHMSTVQRMNAEQAKRVQDLLRDWVPVFDQRVDPVELRLRAAAVIISLATGPYRGQEPKWEAETLGILDSAESLVRQVS